MFQLPTIDYNGGHRTIYENVDAVVQEIKEERHWKNLWLKKTKRIDVLIPGRATPEGDFKDSDGKEIRFPRQIRIHDFSDDFVNMEEGDIIKLNIGYANEDQQRNFGVRPFTASVSVQQRVIVLF
jgi:hypothetical protein